MYQVGVAVIQLLVMTCVARSLSVENNGVFVVGLLISNVLANTMLLGLNTSNIYFLKARKISLNQMLFKNLQYWLLMVFVVSPIIYILLLDFGAVVFPGIKLEVLTAAIVLFVFMLANVLIHSIFQAVDRFDLFNKYLLFNVVMQLISLLTLVYFDLITSLYGIYALIFATSLCFFCGIAHMFFIKKHMLPKDVIKNQPVKSFYKFGFKSHLSNIIAFLMSRADVYMLNYFISPASSAVYMVAVLFVERLGMVSQSLATVIFPDLAALSGDEKKQHMLMCKAFRLNAIVTCVVAGLVSIFIYPAIYVLFGLKYLSATEVFFILVLGVILKSGSRILSVFITAVGKPEMNFYMALIAIMLNITLNYLLIPKFGVYGAAIATTVSYMVNFVIRLVVLRSVVFRAPLSELRPTKVDLEYILSYLPPKRSG